MRQECLFSWFHLSGGPGQSPYFLLQSTLDLLPKGLWVGISIRVANIYSVPTICQALLAQFACLSSPNALCALTRPGSC